MGIYYHPPPAFVGGGQPLAKENWYRVEEGPQVNNPPFTYGGPYLMPYELANLAQPNPWVYTFMGRGQPFEKIKLPILATAVPENDPPFNYPERTIQEISLAASVAQPDPWVFVFFGQQGPFLPMHMSPDIPGLSVNNPPFEHRGRTTARIALLTDMWQPNPWVYDYSGSRQPYDSRRLPIPVTAVPANNPPFDRRRLAQMMIGMPEAWAPYPPLPWHLQATFRIQLSRAKGYILG